jgi:hypothetical protein
VSARNRAIVARLVAEGRMTPAGLAALDTTRMVDDVKLSVSPTR